jgi:hypothetical protein
VRVGKEDRCIACSWSSPPLVCCPSSVARDTSILASARGAENGQVVQMAGQLTGRRLTGVKLRALEARRAGNGEVKARRVGDGYIRDRLKPAAPCCRASPAGRVCAARVPQTAAGGTSGRHARFTSLPSLAKSLDPPCRCCRHARALDLERSASEMRPENGACAVSRRISAGAIGSSNPSSCSYSAWAPS